MHQAQQHHRRNLWIVMLAAVLLLSACGFHIRGKANLPFKTIFLSFGENSPIGTELKRNIEASGGKVVDNKKDAEAILNVVSANTGKQILTLNTDGRVREYALFQYLTFSITDQKGAIMIKPTAITLRRVVTYDPNQELAKQAEEVLLYRDMQSDLVQQILRRLSAAKSLDADKPGDQ